MMMLRYLMRRLIGHPLKMNHLIPNLTLMMDTHSSRDVHVGSRRIPSSKKRLSRIRRDVDKRVKRLVPLLRLQRWMRL
jgi:hypothetical protein